MSEQSEHPRFVGFWSLEDQRALRAKEREARAPRLKEKAEAKRVRRAAKRKASICLWDGREIEVFPKQVSRIPQPQDGPDPSKMPRMFA